MMRRLMHSWLRRVAGNDLARDIEGDVAESGGGSWRLAVIAAGLTTRRFRELRPSLAGAGSDIRYAIRSLRRSPWYAVTTVGVIALSMALAITVFAVVDGVLFKPLPYSHVRELMSVEARRAAVTGGSFSVSASEVTAWQAAVPEAAFATFEFGNSYDIDDGEPAHFTEVSANFFDVLGLRPRIGGFHEPGDRAQGLVSDSMWRRRFGADRAIVGRLMQLDHGKPVEIVGVLPPEFVFPMALGRFVPDVVQLAVPVKDSANNRERSFKVLARVPPAISATLMQQRLHAATLSLAARFPGTPGKAYTRPFDVTTVIPLDTTLRSEARETFTLVFVAAAALVLLACLNVTGLAAARAQDRRHELSLRRALGGRGSDLVRLLGAESLVVVGAGATLGLGMAALLMRVAATLLPNSLVLLRALAIDLRVVVFAAMAAALSVTITTVWPARVTLRSALQPALTASSRSVTRGNGVSRFLLIGTQVGIALVMTVVGALVASSLVRLWREDPGYRVANTMALTLSEPEQISADLNQQLIIDIQHTPGVISAGGSNQFLLQRAIRGSMFETPSNALKTGEVESTAVTGGFFETTDIAPVAGRIPTADEFSRGEHVAVVSQIVAHAYWPDRSAIGQTLIREGRGVGYTVIGVVPDARYIAFDREPEGNIYYPLAADGRSLLTVFVTLDPKARNALFAVRSLMSSRYPMYRIRSAQNLSATLGKSVQTRQFQAALFSAFGLAGLTIAGVGVLALVAIVTSRRTREVGVRMALGAKPLEIAGLIVRQELVAVVCGMTAGGIASFWLVRLMRSYMYKTSVYDPAVWAGAAVLLFVVAVAGALIPALRASRIDPVRALRVE